MFLVTGSPSQGFVDAVKAALVADTTLAALVTGVYGHIAEGASIAMPYVVLGRRGRNGDAGAMQVAGSAMSLQIDVFSDHEGASETHAICGHVSRVLERRNLSVSGFSLIAGSLTLDFEDVFDEPDEDTPTRRIYHGVQRWVCEIHES